MIENAYKCVFTSVKQHIICIKKVKGQIGSENVIIHFDKKTNKV